MDENYIKTLIEQTTRTIQRTVLEILEFLFDKCGVVEDEDLREKEEEIKEIKYELVDPIINIFNEIKYLRNLGVAEENEYSEQQLVKFELQNKETTAEFEHDPRLWHGMTRAQIIWDTFKIHFESAHRILKTIRGKTLQSSAFYQAKIWYNK